MGMRNVISVNRNDGDFRQEFPPTPPPSRQTKNDGQMRRGKVFSLCDIQRNENERVVRSEKKTEFLENKRNDLVYVIKNSFQFS